MRLTWRLPHAAYYKGAHMKPTIHEESKAPPARSRLETFKDLGQIVTLLAALAAGGWGVWIFI